jgi:hypothetical protein
MGPFPFQTKPSERVLRQFAAAWLVFFLLLAANQIWRKGHVPCGVGLAIVSLVGIPGLIKPNSLRLLFLAASMVTYPIGWLVSQVALAVMFYGIMTPLGFFWRIRRRDVLQLRAKPSQTSFWIVRDAGTAPERYLKQS